MDKNDLLEGIKREMRSKLKELQPAVEEHKRIEEALKRMEHNRPGRKRKVAA